MSDERTYENTPAAPRKIFALSQLAESLRVQIDRTFSGSYWITAEISKLNHYPQSGHCYPQLVEKKSGQIVADFRAFILNSRFREINAKFAAATGQTLTDGMQMLCRCKVSFHAVYGLSLNIVDVEPSYTLGEMARMRQEALEKLKKEGIFSQNKSLALPMLIRRLAVISVETSKGYHDFTDILAKSAYPDATKIRLFPALLQGDAAVGSIVSALEKIKKVAGQFDAVTIIRGGGGEVGLDCYDNYEMGRAVCTFPLPVITGIGHATNLTVVEQVAHKNLITPTDLARFITDGFTRFGNRIESAIRSLSIFRKGSLQVQIANMRQFDFVLQKAIKSRQIKEKSALLNISRKGVTAAQAAMREAQKNLRIRYPQQLADVVHQQIRTRSNQVNNQKSALGHLTKATIKSRSHLVQILSEKVKLLDPANTLKRGYSLTLSGGKIVRNADDLQPGDQLETIFAKGRAESTVKKTRP